MCEVAGGNESSVEAAISCEVKLSSKMIDELVLANHDPEAAHITLGFTKERD